MAAAAWSWPLPGIGVTDQFLKEKRDQAKRTVRALVKAILFMRRNREESVRAAMSWLALDRDVAEKSYDMALDSLTRGWQSDFEGVAKQRDAGKTTGGNQGRYSAHESLRLQSAPRGAWRAEALAVSGVFFLREAQSGIDLFQP